MSYVQVPNAWWCSYHQEVHNGTPKDWAESHRKDLCPIYVKLADAAERDPEPITIWPPSEDYDPIEDGPYPWHVVVDMRLSNNEANYEWSDKVVAKLGTLDFEADPETSCSYFYCRTEADAKFVASVIRSVWTEGL